MGRVREFFLEVAPSEISPGKHADKRRDAQGRSGSANKGDKAVFLAATKVYSEPFAHGAGKNAYGELETDCVNADCVEVANGLLQIGYNPAILNLASRHHACGGYDSGAGAQEESLCRVSTLSQSLYQYFDPSRRCVREAEVEPRGNAYPLGINFGGIYSPGVTFFRHGPKRGLSSDRSLFAAV